MTGHSSLRTKFNHFIQASEPKYGDHYVRVNDSYQIKNQEIRTSTEEESRVNEEAYGVPLI